MIGLVDTHCHLNLPDRIPDPARAVEEALAAGVERQVVIGIDEPTSRLAVDLAERFESVWATVGWHPTSVDSYSNEGRRLLAELLQHPKVVALGEIGLDYYWDRTTPEQQDAALFDQLDLAQELEVPVVFHCREAYPALLDRLETRGPGRYLFHCFAGDLEDARRAIALGGFFGVDGPITYKKANELRMVVSELPSDRVVLETDAPFLPPEPHRGKPNWPAYIPLINAAYAKLRGWSEAESAQRTGLAAAEFFGWG